MRGGAGALHLLIRLEHLLHHRREVLHVEPDRDKNKGNPDEEFENPAEPRIASHGVQHFIVLFRETKDFV